MIHFECECGKQLQTRDENAGKLVLCPACQRQLTVPQSEPTAIPSEEPVELPAEESRVQRQRPALRDEPEEEAEDRPRRREPAGNSGKAIVSLVLGIVSFCGCSCLTGLPSILFGILSLRDIGRAAGAMTGKPMAIIGIVLGTLGTLCLPVPYFFMGKGFVSGFQERNNSQASLNNLKQMALAMHNYNDTYGGQLPAAGFGSPGNPNRPPPPGQKAFLSSRVAILPYIEQQLLYQKFNLNEPWDGPTNIKLLAQMPKIYKLPGDDQTKPDHTHYQVFVGNGAAFEKTRTVRFPTDFTDGTSNTILIVEAANAVPWTKPEDVEFDPRKPMVPLLSTYFKNGCNVALGDGSVMKLKPTISETTLKAAITRDGGEGQLGQW